MQMLTHNDRVNNNNNNNNNNYNNNYYQYFVIHWNLCCRLGLGLGLGLIEISKYWLLKCH